MKRFLYVVQCQQTGAHKIGITGDWDRRSRELDVGNRTALVRLARVGDARKAERLLHRLFAHRRIPQTEYFMLTEAERDRALALTSRIERVWFEQCFEEHGYRPQEGVSVDRPMQPLPKTTVPAPVLPQRNQESWADVLGLSLVFRVARGFGSFLAGRA